MAYGTPYLILAEDCEASDHHLKGRICLTKEEVNAHPEYLCDAGEMEWDLKLQKVNAFHVGYGASRPLRFLKAFEMYWHAEGMKTLVSGRIKADGEYYRVLPESSYGYADKNWGSGFTSPWVWLSSNHLTSLKTGTVLSDSVFDIGGGRPKIYFLPLDRKLLGAFRYEGASHEYNFSKFWMGVRTKFHSWETDEEICWEVAQENFHSVMLTRVKCRKEDMILVNYEAPDGTKRHNRLWNGGNGIGRIRLYRKQNGKRVLIDDIAADHIGCEFGEYDR